jgi:hypothetical protein
MKFMYNRLLSYTYLTEHNIIEAVVMKLKHVSLKPVKDFVTSYTSINRMLVAVGHRQLLHTTLTIMFEVIAELVFRPNVGPEAGTEPNHAV